jgi:ATP-dependent Clp protease ATP-binding subunit ClpA
VQPESVRYPERLGIRANEDPERDKIENLRQMVQKEEIPGSGFEFGSEWCSRLSGLTPVLESKIIGQKGAISRVARAIQAAEIGLNGQRSQPKASFLFLGPTGVGKTETAKCFSEYIFGSRAALEMVLMNEYSADSRFQEFLKRTEAAIRRHPKGTTLLFDEIEKAHPRLVDVFLSLLEEGILTTPAGDRVHVGQFYLVMTSNLGSGDLAKMENAPYSTMERVALDVASQSLRPELFARIAERIVFRPLDLETQKIILAALIKKKLSVLSQFFGRPLTIDSGPVMAFLLRVGYNKAQGARMLRQEVDRQLNSASLVWALNNEAPKHGVFLYDPTAGGLILR